MIDIVRFEYVEFNVAILSFKMCDIFIEKCKLLRLNHVII